MNDKKEKPLPKLDAFIASTAIEHKLSFVTRDADFKRVPGLDVVQL